MNITPDSVTVGHQVAFGWEWIDVNGNPPPAGTVLPVPDSTPTWSDARPILAVDTFSTLSGRRLDGIAGRECGR